MITLKRALSVGAALAAAIAVCGAGLRLDAPELVGPHLPPALITETLGALQDQLLSATPTEILPPTDTPTMIVPPTETPTETPSPTPTATDTPSPTPTETPTNTPAPPMLSVSATTNCYAGPRTNYGLVYTLRPGIVALVVGVDLPDSFWIISVPGYPGTVCWLSSQYAMVTGDTSRLPAPATPIISNYTLDEPKNLSISCSSVPYSDEASTWNVTLHWTNTDPNQTGVRIYRLGRVITTLGGRARSFTNSFIHYDFHSGIRYGVQAVSGSSVSSIVWVHINSCR